MRGITGESPNQWCDQEALEDIAECWYLELLSPRVTVVHRSMRAKSAQVDAPWPQAGAGAGAVSAGVKDLPDQRVFVDCASFTRSLPSGYTMERQGYEAGSEGKDTRRGQCDLLT